MKINHVLIRAKDTVGMVNFFQRSIGLTNGPRPPFPFSGAWLYSDGEPIIHLVDEQAPVEQDDYLSFAAEADNQVSTGVFGFVDHVALEGADYGLLIQRLINNKNDFVERTVPESGEHQVFVFGPEQVKVEMIFAASDAVL